MRPRVAVVLAALFVLAAPLIAQVRPAPSRVDSLRADSARAAQRAQALVPMRVEVTRAPATGDRTPWAVAT